MGNAIGRGMDRALSPTIACPATRPDSARTRARQIAAFARGMRRAIDERAEWRAYVAATTSTPPNQPLPPAPPIREESTEARMEREAAEDTITRMYARTSSRAHEESRALAALARIDTRSR
jgi:hypothetical protein